MNGRVGIIWMSQDGLGDFINSSIDTDTDTNIITNTITNTDTDTNTDTNTNTIGRAVQGTGVAVVRNHVETLGGTTCWSVDGKRMTHGSTTNENRGYDQQGNSCRVHDQ